MKGTKKNKPYSKDKFTYNTKKDYFTCPQGETLTRKGEYNHKPEPIHTCYGANCSACPHQTECAGKDRKKVITSNQYGPERQRMAQKMQTPEAQKEYQKRKETGEWPFGNIKHNMNFTHFLNRGITKQEPKQT